MKRIILLICCFSVIGRVSAQGIRKVRMEELEAYIQESKGPLVVNFWASFCRPCLQEIPFLLAQQQSHPDVELVLVSLDLPDFYPKKLETFISSKSLQPVTHFWLDETNADAFCPRIDKSWTGNIPVTLFINHRKNYRQFVNKAMTEEEVKNSFLALDTATN